VFAATAPTDMRKSFAGLWAKRGSTLVRKNIEARPDRRVVSTPQSASRRNAIPRPATAYKIPVMDTNAMNALSSVRTTPTESDEQADSCSVCGLSVLSGTAINSWSAAETVLENDRQLVLKISPDRPVIIGRAEGGSVPYLDPAYRPTTVLPGTGETILRGDGHGTDSLVSRGHFMLAATAGGITFVNGVPRRGGGIRPPKNGTWLVLPTQRILTPGEDYFIENGSSIGIRLPNGSEIIIDARANT
jgi:hypothetical protein